MLEVESLATGYGGVPVLHGVDLAVSEGEVVGVLGPNGAGKTTLLRCLSGLLKATSGRIRLDGQDVTRVPAAARVRHGFAHVPEGRQVFASMSVRENLLMGAYTARATVADLLEQQYERFPLLGKRQSQSAGSLSGGEQQMLAIARGLMSEPKLVALDEPSLGLAPVMVDRVVESIQALRTDRRTILLVEQNPLVALATADRVLVMRRGVLVDMGTVDDLRESGRWLELLSLEEAA